MSQIDDFLNDSSPAAPVTNSAAAPAKKATSEVDDFLSDAPSQARGITGMARDMAAWGVKGAIGLVEAPVGLTDIFTGGRVGKALENEGGAFGFRPKQAREAVNDWHSEATKDAQRKFQEAEGIGGKFQAAIQNPSNIVGAVAESLPSMAGGAVAARGLLGLTRLGQMGAKGATIAGAAGEGIVMAGSQAEAIRQETKDGLLTPGQAGIAALTGGIGGLIGGASGRFANKLGVGDADTMLAQGAKGIARQNADEAATAAANPLMQQATKSVPRQVIEGAITEGLLEELPQSVAEQLLQNLALDKPWSEGLDDAIVLGALSGGAMGAGAAGFRGITRPGEATPGAAPSAGPAPTPVPPGAGQPPLGLPAPSAQGTQEQPPIQVDANGVARTQPYQTPGYVGAGQGDVTDVVPKEPAAPIKPSEAMGLNPAAGALSAAAVQAVDSGASDTLQAAAAQAQTAEQAARAPAPTKAQAEEIDLADIADPYERAYYESFFADAEDAQIGPEVQTWLQDDTNIPDLDAASSASDEDFLRALGANDQEITDAIASIASQPSRPQEDAQSLVGAQANEPADTRQGAGEAARAQGGQVDAGARGEADADISGVDRPGLDDAGRGAADTGAGMPETGGQPGAIARAPDAGNAQAAAVGGSGAVNDALTETQPNTTPAIAQQAPAAINTGAQDNGAAPKNLKEGLAAIRAKRAEEQAAQAGVNPQAEPGISQAEPGISQAEPGISQAEPGISQVEPGPQVVYGAASPYYAPVGDIRAVVPKQIPDMTDAEIGAAIAHYGPDHARTGKLQKEQARRAAVSPQQGATNGTQADQAQQTGAKQTQAGAAQAGAGKVKRPKAGKAAQAYDQEAGRAIRSGVLSVSDAEEAGVSTSITWPAHREWIATQAPRMSLRDFQIALKGRHGMAGHEVDAIYKARDGGSEISAVPAAPAANPKQAKALELVGAGKAFFFSKQKADAFIADNSLTGTHAVEQEGRSFHVRAAAAASSAQGLSPTAAKSGEAARRLGQISAVLSSGGYVQGAELRSINGMTMMRLNDDELGGVPKEAFRSPPSPQQMQAAATAGANTPAKANADAPLSANAEATMDAAPAPKPAPVKPSVKARIEAARQARADHFAPGNIVKSYSGHDRVVSYSPPPKEGGNWSVTVQAVVKQGDAWVDVPNESQRTHSTQPGERELKVGPVEKAQAKAADAKAPASLVQAAKDNGKLEIVTVGDKKPAPEQKGIALAGWTPETGDQGNTIWTKTANSELYTATLDPAASTMEVTVLVGVVDSQIASFNVESSEQAARMASEAVARDVAETKAEKKKPAPAQEAAGRHEHAGLKIYPIKVKVGGEVVAKWAVQTLVNAEREKNGERQLGGDPIADTLDGAKALAEGEIEGWKRLEEYRADMAALDEKKKESDAIAKSKKDANKGKSIVERGRDARLDSTTNIHPSFGLGTGSKRESMQMAVAQGRLIEVAMVRDEAAKKRDKALIVSGRNLPTGNVNYPGVKEYFEAAGRLKANDYEKPEYRVFNGRDSSGSFYRISKTEYDYAQGLIAGDLAMAKLQANPAAADDLDAMFDDVLAEEVAKDAPKPQPKPTNLKEGIAQARARKAPIQTDEALTPEGGPATESEGQGAEDVRFSRSTKPGPTFSPAARMQAVQAVEKTANAIRNAWANGPQVVVAFDMQDPVVPESARRADLKQRSGGARGAPEGFYYRGKVYLIASKLNTVNDAARVLFHEALGHHGLRGAFGKEMDGVLNQVATMRRAQVDAKIKEYGLRGVNSLDRRAAAEEVLAELAQSRPEIGFVKRAVAAIRNWLRANVPGFKSLAMTDNDIIEAFILPARRFVEGGPRGPGGGVRIEPTMGAFSRATDQTQTEAFKKWFADSKVVDAEGNPLVVYHGTDADFAVFDASKSDTATGQSEGAFWFTSSPAVSEIFGNTTMPVYLAASNLFEVTPQNIKSLFPGFYGGPQVVVIDGRAATADINNEIMLDGRAVSVFDALKDGRAEAVIDPRIRKLAMTAAKKAGADGVVLRGFYDASDAASDLFAIFDPTQIKSATGNNGDFDPANPDIRFSRTKLNNLKNTALDQIHQTLSHPGKVSLWDKTVGTMRHLAERNPAFKPVFESAQRSIDDVSTMANDAADHAPRILPRLEGWSDLGKKPVSAADNKAIGKALFEGTLTWARDASGKPVLVSDLEKKYANLDTEAKTKLLMDAGQIDAGVLKMWRGLPIDQFEKLINSRFESKMLKAGVVWSDQELKTLMGMNDQQVSLYREARAALDRSIDMTSRASMLRLVGQPYAAMRGAVLDAPTLQDAMDLLTSTLVEDAKADPDASERLMQQHNQVVDRATQARDLMDAGYMPLSRFGQYTLDVVDAAGERQYFSLFESVREANQMALKMRSAFPGANVVQGTMSQQAFKLFQGVTPESLEMFGNMLGLDSEGNEAKDKAFQEYLKLTKNNHSALKRMIHRQGIAGYSEDVGRVLAGFVYSNARQAAGALNAGTMEQALMDIPKEQGELKDVALGLRSYISDPQEEGQAVRGMLFAQYLGGSVASAFVNMTQPFAVTLPWLSQFGGITKAGKYMASALNDMRKRGFKYEADLAKALQAAEDDGTVSPQEVHQLMAQSRGAGALRSGDGTRTGDARAAVANNWERLKVGWGQPFALAEQFNRRSTFIAAYRMAKANGEADPAAFASKAVLETQFLYSKANKMRWGRGAVGGTLMTFKTYSISYLELMHRTWNAGAPGSPERAAGRRAVGWGMAMLMLMGGAGGLPFMEDLEDLIDALAQLMGYNVSAKQWRQQAMEDVVGKELADFLGRGISGLPGSPVDVSGRLGMGDLLPGTGLFQTKQSHVRDMLELAGPAGDLVGRAFSGGARVLKGDLAGAALEFSPSAVRNAAKGVDMGLSGIYKDTKGYKVLDTTIAEALSKGIGFQPKSVADVQEANSFMMRSKAFYTQTSSEIRAQWAKAIFDKDDAAVQRARERLADWNENNPDQRIAIRMPDVWKRVREMGKDRTQRIADTAPKALRQKLREDAQE